MSHRFSLLAAGKRFAKDRKGLAAIEFALAAPALVILLVGVTDVGMFVYNRMDTTSAIQAGAQYYMAGGTDTSAALTAVRRSWSSMPERTELTSNKICYCAEVAHSCTVNCPDTSLPVAYHQIKATITYEGALIENQYVISENVRVR